MEPVLTTFQNPLAHNYLEPIEETSALFDVDFEELSPLSLVLDYSSELAILSNFNQKQQQHQLQ